MSVRINHNRSALVSHRNLIANENMLRGSLEKLSSGMKINRASDGPASLIISEQLRAQISSLNQAVRNSETAVSMVQTTEGALNETNRMLVAMRSLAIHAANEGVNDEIMLQADQLELDNALATVDRISSQTQFGRKKLLDGSNGASGVTIGEGLEFLKASTKTVGSKEGYDVHITQNAKRSSITGAEALTEDNIKAGETLTVIENGKIARYQVSENDTVKTAVSQLANTVKEAGLEAEVSLDSSNRLSVHHIKYGKDYEFQVSSTTAGLLSEEAGDVQNVKNGLDIKGSINGEAAIGKGQILTGAMGASTIDGLQVGYYGVAGEDGEVSGGEGENVGQVTVSQNSLTFQIGGNADQTASISLFNSSAMNLAKGVKNDSNFTRLRDINLTTSQGSQDSLKLIDKAINEITAIRGELGAFQKNTLEGNLTNTRIAVENLVAAESTVRDTDMAAEMAVFTRNQIMTESATAMLAHANRIPNTIIKLLG